MADNGNNNPNTGDNNAPNNGNNNQNGGNNNQNGGNQQGGGNNNNQQGGGNNNQNGGGNAGNNQQGGGNNNNQNGGNNNNQNGGNNNNQNGNNGNNASPGPTAAPSATGNRGNNTNAANSTSTSISINPQAPPGGIQMLQPASSSTSYYKVGQNEYITFQWNFTSLIVHPKTLTVRAFNANANYYYPVGPLPTGNLSMGGIFPGNTTQVVWNPYEWAQQSGQPPLKAAEYDLQIADERGYTQRPSGGYLSPYTGKTKFAMYFPQPYTPLSNWTCTTCSGRLSMDSPATLPVLMSILIVVFSAWSLLRRDLA